jgi:hypothetical protein
MIKHDKKEPLEVSCNLAIDARRELNCPYR